MNTLFFITLGMFLGWNIPQPEYAKRIQARVMDWLRSFGNRSK